MNKRTSGETGGRLLGTLARFWNSSVPPAGSDPKAVLAASALRTTLAGLSAWLALQFAFFIPFLIVKKATSVAFGLVLLLSVLASLHYLRIGRVRLASWILVSTLWVLGAVEIVLAGYIASYSVVGLMAITVATAWLLEYEMTIVGAGLMLGITLGMALLENAGVRLPRYFPSRPLVAWSRLCLYVAVAVLPLSQVLRAMYRALGETIGRAAFNQAVWDSLTAHVSIVDAQGAIVATNRAWDRFATENGSDFRGKWGLGANYLEVCAQAASSGDMLAQQALVDLRALQDGALDRFDLEYPCDSPSEERWFAMHATRLEGAGRSLVVSHDNITDRKKAEEALRESENKFHTLATLAPVGIFRTDAEGRSIYANEAMCRISGRTLEESQGFGWMESVHADDRSRVGDSWRESVRKQLPTKVQSRVLRKDGLVIHTVVEAGPVLDAKGRLLGYVGTLTDISDLKQAEEALRDSEDRLRRLNEDLEGRVALRTQELEDARRVALSMMQDADIQRHKAEQLLQELSDSTSKQVMLWQAVENSPALIMVTDIHANIQYVNPKFVDVTGFSAEEVIGKTPFILKSGEHTRDFYEHLWTTIKAGKTWVGEFCNRKKSGELFWETASISPVRAADGEISQFLSINEDITGIKRTAEELMRARDAADAANQAKSAFLASMSHEIRTPLNAILGYSQLALRDASLNAGSRESLRIINRSGEHLLALINAVLEVAKIEAGRVGLAPVEFDLHALLDDVAAMFRLPTVEKGLSFSLTKEKDLPRRVIADEGKIRQVLINLVGNAVKFTKQGLVRVRAAASQTEAGQLWLAIEIADTGAGIKPEEMGRLFQYFEQTESGRETLSGSGLGLVISREYARRMGGEISAASEYGSGSVFRFEIPIAQTAVEPPAGATSQDERRVEGLAPGQEAIRVLVADDHDSNRGWLCALLECVGFEVREARNGQEALEIWQEWRPKLILMDMRMPVMDGYEATRRIRTFPGGDSTVIIALTASALDERLSALMDAGVDDLVCKPFKEGSLFDTIRTHLDVRFRYAESEESMNAQLGEPVSTTAISLTGLPAELLASMRQAILGCDMDGFIHLLPQVAELYPSAATSLRELAEKYDYDRLAGLMSEHP
jgi:two-component system, sensor histidine kinase and response regulator